MRTHKYLLAFCLLSVLVAIPALATGQVVQSVRVSEERGQTLITISGERLPRPTVKVWRKYFLILEFGAHFSGRNRESMLKTPHVSKLRYGWFSHRPPRVRVVATLRGTHPYTLEQTADGWQVRLGKMQPLSKASETPSLEPTEKPKETVVASTQSVAPSRTKMPEAEKSQEMVAYNTAPTSPAPPRVLVSLDFVNAEIGDVLKALAIQSGANIVTAPDVKGTVTVSLSRLTVEESLNLITRLSGYRYEKIDNTYVVGTEASLKAFRGATEPLAPPKPRTVEALTFKVAKPSEIATYLSARFPELKVTPSGEKGTTYLLVEGEAEIIERAREAAYAFEQQLTGSVEIVTEVYRVKYADSRDLARIIVQLVPGVQVSLGPDAMLSRGGTGASGAAQGSMTGGETPSQTAQQMGAPMQGGGNAGGAQGAQPPNTLVLVGTAREVLRALEILRKVDVKQPQVVIEARVLDVSEGSLQSLGLSWNILQSGRVNTLDRSANQLPLPDSTTNTPNQQGIGFNRDGQLGLDFTIVKKPIDFSVTLNALAEDRRNRLLANPRVATLDGRPATIFIGDEVNYVKLIQQTPQGANVQTDSVQAGIILKVLPRVHEDDSITLQIQPEVSVITGFLEVPGGGRLPQLARRNADTTIRVGNGETIVIGGLIREADIKTIQKVPLLGDLPFLGYLFRKTTTSRDKSEIMITLTVRVME
ncbi:MAG: secretin and TonB N-terminal domain-containing protein [Fimbriimonadales bacterium]|nr:secretin and TonB N-terminal domain-containing protein [Fimbriimonadales bacterium]